MATAFIACAYGQTSEVHMAALDSPRPWKALAPELRYALQTGRLRYSDQIPSSPFGASLPTMDDRVEINNIPLALDRFATTGLKWIRDGAVSGYRDGQFNIIRREGKLPDLWVEFCKEAHARGIRLVVVLRVLGLPGGKVSASGELGRTALREWCETVVPVLKPWVRDWEVDNEPNPEIPPKEYVAACRVVYETIKRIDPEARIYGGVLASLECMLPKAKGGKEPYPDPNSCYLDGLLEAGLLDVCDVFSVHTYRQPYLLSSLPEHETGYLSHGRRWPDYPTQIRALKDRLQEAGGRVFPIAITEFGIPTHFDKGTRQHRIGPETAAKYMLRAHVMDAHLGFDPIIHFAFKRQVQGLYDREAHFQLVRPEWVREPKYFALASLASLLDGRDEPIDVLLTVVSPQADAEEAAIYAFTFRKRVKVEMTEYANPKKGLYVPDGMRVDNVEMISIYFWRAVQARDDHAALPVQMQVTLPREDYGYPVLLDPMTMTTRPFRAMAYRQSAKTYDIESLTAADSPRVVRFHRVVVTGE